jgi:hypothetical protein
LHGWAPQRASQNTYVERHCNVREKREERA